MAIPGFVNGFFACELYLKILADNKIHKHDLALLFSNLGSSDREKLVSNYKQIQTSEMTFEEFLKNLSNGFEFWRYLYEEKTKEFEKKFPFFFSEQFLSVYLPILQEMAENHKPIHEES